MIVLDTVKNGGFIIMSKHLYQIFELTGDKIIEGAKFGSADEALMAQHQAELEEEKVHMLGEKADWSHYLVVVRW